MTVPVPAETAPASLRLAEVRAHGLARAADRPAGSLPGFTDLTRVPLAAWQKLHSRALEANAYYDPLWAVPVAQFAPGRDNAIALLAVHRTEIGRLTGLLPVRSAWHALALPVPMLVGWSAYAPLCIPTLDRECAQDAAKVLLNAARSTGAHALFLQAMAAEGPAFDALKRAAGELGFSFRVLRSNRRAALDATGDAATALRDALGAKKLKELRRQRNRLEDLGSLMLDVADCPVTVADALERFLQLEAAGWKGRRGTAMIQREGEAAFIRKAAAALAAQGCFEVVSLVRTGRTIASGLMLRDRNRAYFFKIAMDESLSRSSPGVQLTLDITRRLCADRRIAFVDSTADSDHAMIDRVWRQRIVMADVFIALSPRDPMAAAMRLLLQSRYRALDLYRWIRRIRR